MLRVLLKLSDPSHLSRSVFAAYLGPASMTATETLAFSVRRPATTLPAVPPSTTTKSNSSRLVKEPIVKFLYVGRKSELAVGRGKSDDDDDDDDV